MDGRVLGGLQEIELGLSESQAIGQNAFPLSITQSRVPRMDTHVVQDCDLYQLTAVFSLCFRVVMGA